MQSPQLMFGNVVLSEFMFGIVTKFCAGHHLPNTTLLLYQGLGPAVKTGKVFENGCLVSHCHIILNHCFNRSYEYNLSIILNFNISYIFYTYIYSKMKLRNVSPKFQII